VPAFRFRPPELDATPELAWLLVRAFGRRDGCLPGAVDGAVAVTLARALDLAPRIAGRTDRATLEVELGIEAARTLLAIGAVAQLSAEALVDLAREVVDVARHASVGLVFLKGMALQLMGRVRPGARWACDVDVLVPSARIDELAAALAGRGYQELTAPESEHQWAPLRRASGETVELHRFLPGVRLAGERGFATVEGLRREGLLIPLPDLGETTAAPCQTVLAAHALAHGIAQHGFAPASYPMSRMIADLLDLGWGESACDDIRASVLSMIAPDVAEEEVSAVWDLCAALRRGDTPPSPIPRDAPTPWRLLAHVVAGALDARYRDGLKLRALGSGPSVLPRPIAFVRDAARSVWPSRARLAALHGRPVGGLGMAVLRIARPFDLAWRAVRATWNAATPGGRPPTR
jgi:hypothetical protein